MTDLTTTHDSPFDARRWLARAPELRTAYRTAGPFPHIVLDDFLAADTARRLGAAFAEVDWKVYRHYNENKQGANHALPEVIASAIAELNAAPCLAFLQSITGIEGLIADSELGSGGIHQSGRGGFLNIHADFTAHPYHRDWERRINVLIYLSEQWEDEWGGQLELWERDMSRLARKIKPVFNRCVIFNTAKDSFHGHPEPTNCPPDVMRRSIALYYYTLNAKAPAIATLYRPRPTDGRLKSALIAADKYAVAGFHRLKSTFRLRDDPVTSLMSLFGRRPRRERARGTRKK